MNDRPRYRRHAPEFKRQVCEEIRSGVLGRRDAQRKYGLSDNLLQQWLARFDAEQRGEAPPPGNPLLSALKRQIEALQRKVGQLTMELEQRREPQGQGADAPRDER